MKFLVFIRKVRWAALLLAIIFILVITSVGCGSAGAASAASASVPVPAPTPTPTPTPGPAPTPTPGASAPAIAIVSPLSNSTVTGSVRICANVTAANAVTLKIFLDGAQIWVNVTTAVDTTIAAPDGQHHLSIQATDAAGNIAEAAVDFIAASVPKEVPPAFVVVLDRIEEQSEWLTCGSCGNAGGTGNVATYLMERGIASPSLDSSAARFSIGGTYQYANAYWYIKHSAPATRITSLRYEFDLYIPAEFASAPQAIEFECQQQVGGYVYNFAWQADYAAKSWRTFDYVNRVWQSTSVAMNQLTPDTWHHIVAESHTGATTVVHDALTIDGTRYAVGVTHDAKAVGSTSKSFTNAFQLDLNKVPTAYSVYVDAMKVSYN